MIKDIPIPMILKDLEHCILKLNITEDNKNIFRSQTTNVVTNFYNKDVNKFSNWHTIGINHFISAKNFINDNINLFIMRSEKGDSTVLMERDEYMKYMTNMLQDQKSYQLLVDDATIRYQCLANELVNELKHNQIINEQGQRQLKIHNSGPPKLYELRKTHKNSLYLKPVASCIDSPSYNLAALVHNILSTFTTTFEYTVLFYIFS